MLVLGIDPGSLCTGYGLVEGDHDRVQALEYGAIRTSPKEPLEFRLGRIYEGLRQIIGAHRPDWIALESPFVNKNVQSAFKLGQAKGVALLAARHEGIPLVEYSPREVKSTVTGYGGADKGQIQQMVKRTLGLRELPSPSDAADALAIALCHIYSHAGRERIALHLRLK